MYSRNTKTTNEPTTSNTKSGKNVTLINIYIPNNDCATFFSKVSDVIENFDNQSIIITVHYNLVQNQDLDTYNYCNEYLGS